MILHVVLCWSANFLNSLVNSNFYFWEDFLRSYMYTNMSSVNRDCFVSSLSISVQFSFSCPVTLAINFSTMLIEVLAWFLMSGEKAFILNGKPLSMKLAICLCRCSLSRWGNELLLLVCWQFLTWISDKIMLFLHQFIRSCVFLFSLLVWRIMLVGFQILDNAWIPMSGMK